MEHSVIDRSLTSTLPPFASSEGISALQCYLLQKENGADGFTATLMTQWHNLPADSSQFLLFCEADFAPTAALLQQLAALDRQRPELRCYLISQAPRSLSEGLNGSLQLFQQLQQQRLWQQNNFAVIMRADMAIAAAPILRIQDALLGGLLASQTTWLINAESERGVITRNPPLTWQQFISETEKITRLSHFIPERNSYRQSYLRYGVLQLVQQELSQQPRLSVTLRDAIRYFSDQFPANGAMEKLLLKQPDLYFSLMKIRKSR